LSSAAYFPDRWDEDFEKSAEVYLPPGIDWRLLKAQCFQESSLRPDAVSPVGAFGLCQFMPGTAADVSKQLGVTVQDFWKPSISIRAAALYMGKLHRTWRAPRPLMDRHMLAMASYNAGAGHLIMAQSICGGGNLYKQIIPCLPKVTGTHSKETIDYVDRILNKWWPRLMFS
jgi:membrane-bound lytic murein transglycosylase F